MSRSVKLNLVSMFTPSAYSKQVNLWWENVGVDWLLAEKSDGSVNTSPLSSPSNIENCQK